MEKITLQNNMDDGYGAVYCIKKETFLLNEIHDYFRYHDGIPQDPVPESLRTPFKTVEALVTFLEEELDNAFNEGDYAFLNLIASELKPSDMFDHYLSVCGENSGNTVDSLVVTYEGEIIFEH